MVKSIQDFATREGVEMVAFAPYQRKGDVTQHHLATKVAPATAMLPHGAVFVYPFGNQPDDEIVVAYLDLT